MTLTAFLVLLLVFGVLVFIVGTISSGATDAADNFGEALAIGLLLTVIGVILLAVAWFVTKGILAP